MCARRFLFVVFVFTLLVVGAAFALFQWGGDVLLKQATPKGHFVAAAAGGGPDYSEPGNWVARPGLADDPSRWQPDDAGESPAGTANAATFYIHPTTYLLTDRWNAPLDASGETAERRRLFVKSQASAFSGSSDVWAPKYRQAAYGAFLLESDDARKALDLAYSDVRAAFDSFLAAQPKDRPIILAGHSQGALHLYRLLVDRHEQLKGRLVAAYVVGWPISTSADLPSMGFPACKSREQTGCILSWMSFGDPPDADLILDNWRKTKGPTGLPRRAEDVLCVNPLTGTENGASAPPANLGTLVPTADFSSARLASGQVGAECRNGLLIVSGSIPPLGPFVLPGNNYHVYDYALFWGSIRADAAARLAAWQR
ncbi:MAG TPA: DUF3089 domain-containing protein [Sphingomicrobium sp.]